MRILLLFSLLVGAGPVAAWAQQPSDMVSWLAAGVRLQPDSSRWALEASYNHLAYQGLTRTFVQVGRGQVSYAWPRPHLTLALTYITGPVDEQGTVHLGQLSASQTLPGSGWHPRWQLTLDRLALTPTRYRGRERAAVYRVRTLVGIQPQLRPRVQLVLNTEPFVYRTDAWLSEVRSQVGVQVQPVPRLALQVLYWNWWAGYESRRVEWQHTLYVTATWALGQRGPLP